MEVSGVFDLRNHISQIVLNSLELELSASLANRHDCNRESFFSS